MTSVQLATVAFFAEGINGKFRAWAEIYVDGWRFFCNIPQNLVVANQALHENAKVRGPGVEATMTYDTYT